MECDEHIAIHKLMVTFVIRYFIMGEEDSVLMWRVNFKYNKLAKNID